MEITERVEKIHGVRDTNNQITLLPVSQMDDRIRVIIANRTYTILCSATTRGRTRGFT
jgi:HrpA-like RNA helicase